MEIEMKKAQKLTDGIHYGEIVDVTYDNEPYAYTRIAVKVDDAEMDMTLEYSCPTNLTEASKLMRLLTVFGIDFEEGKKINPSETLIGTEVVFQVINKPSKKDTTKVYSEIVEDSLKPVEADM